MHEPPDPLGSLNTAAVALHELYLSLRDGGFSEDEALSLVCRVMLNQSEHPSGKDGA